MGIEGNIEITNGKLNNLEKKYIDGLLKINNKQYNFPFTNARCTVSGIFNLNFEIELECLPIECLNDELYLCDEHVQGLDGLSRLVKDEFELGFRVKYCPPETDRSNTARVEIRSSWGTRTYQSLNINIKARE